jgi:ribonucleoside-diphosphate reductase beta chain
MHMQEQEAVEIVERSSLEALGALNPDVVYAHIDYLGRELPGPIDLYRRWERQQWSATGIDFRVDRMQWQAMPEVAHEELEGTFLAFFYGEQAVTDTLSPMVHAAPDEENRLFLSTQLVDEARHSYFFARFFNEVLGVGDGLRGALAHIDAQFRELTGDAGDYNRIFRPGTGELATVTEAVRARPDDYGLWVQSIATYHLMIEAMLALPGQRRVLRLTRINDILPGFRAGFTAVTRDESRHVSYGVWALREAVKAGREPEIRTIVDRNLAACLGVGIGDGENRLPHPTAIPPSMRLDPREEWSFTVDSLTKRLRTAALDPEYIADVDRRAWDQINGMVRRYEDIHGEEHPLRAWERGEVTAATG